MSLKNKAFEGCQHGLQPHCFPHTSTTQSSPLSGLSHMSPSRQSLPWPPGHSHSPWFRECLVLLLRLAGYLCPHGIINSGGYGVGLCLSCLQWSPWCLEQAWHRVGTQWLSVRWRSEWEGEDQARSKAVVRGSVLVMSGVPCQGNWRWSL